MLPSDTYAQLVHEAEADGIQQIAVGAVIQRDGRVLILRRSADDFVGGIWELPSGKVDPGETLGQSLVREVLEETGLTVTAVSRYLGNFDYRSSGGKRSRQYNFAVDVDKSESVELAEHDAYAWADITDDLPVTEAVKAVLAAR